MRRFNKFPWENIFLIHLKIVSHLLLFPVWPWNTFSFLSEKTNHRNGDSYKSPFRRFLMDITNMFWAFWLFSALLKEGLKNEGNRNFNIQVKITAGSLWKASKRKIPKLKCQKPRISFQPNIILDFFLKLSQKVWENIEVVKYH